MSCEGCTYFYPALSIVIALFGTLPNIVLTLIYLSLDRRTITDGLLFMYSLFNAATCLQTLPVAISILAPIPLKACPVLHPLWSITTQLSTLVLMVISIDLSLHVIYKCPRASSKRVLTVLLALVGLTILLELSSLKFVDKVHDVVTTDGWCTWSFTMELDVLNYRYLKGLITIILPCFSAISCALTLLCVLTTVNPRLTYLVRVVSLLCVSFLAYNSFHAVTLIREAVGYFVQKYANEEGTVFQYHESSDFFMPALCSMTAPLIIFIGDRQLQERLFYSTRNNVQVMSETA
eukprot:sb/3467593/